MINLACHLRWKLCTELPKYVQQTGYRKCNNYKDKSLSQFYGQEKRTLLSPESSQSHTSPWLACLLLKYLNCCSCLKGFRKLGANKEFFINVESRNQWSPGVMSFQWGEGGDGGGRNSNNTHAAGRLPAYSTHHPLLLISAHKWSAE